MYAFQVVPLKKLLLSHEVYTRWLHKMCNWPTFTIELNINDYCFISLSYSIIILAIQQQKSPYFIHPRTFHLKLLKSGSPNLLVVPPGMCSIVYSVCHDLYFPEIGHNFRK